MDNKEELNDVLDDLAPFIRAGFRPDKKNYSFFATCINIL